ncbi:hypothetical protein B296_00007117 [Ensete ventricosum]|uniref:DRBM domain-containing protein n=1 Tax=Ensete ventricosum TaxID=4639 RepID=A0A427AR46_ENSVE|nr:hypothetical protein B296_00007117 [Ensete ventricosum]
MYKNQLQELAQRSCFNLPSYTCIREGPDHAPRFKAAVNFNGELFESPSFCTTLRQAEHSAAEVALNALSQRGPSHSLAARILENNDEQEQITIARVLLNYRLKVNMAMANYPHGTPFPNKFPIQLEKRPASVQPSPSVSKILPLIRQKSAPRVRATSSGINDATHLPSYQQVENQSVRPQKFPIAGAAPYFSVRHFSRPCQGIAPPVTIRTAVPVFSAPPLPPATTQVSQLPPVNGHTPIRMASPVRIRQSVPVFAAPQPVPPVTSVIPAQVKKPLSVVASSPSTKEPASVSAPAIPVQLNQPVPVAAASPLMKEPLLVVAPAVSVQIKEEPLPSS